jgi:hypothetical protein
VRRDVQAHGYLLIGQTLTGQPRSDQVGQSASDQVGENCLDRLSDLSEIRVGWVNEVGPKVHDAISIALGYWS